MKAAKVKIIFGILAVALLSFIFMQNPNQSHADNNDSQRQSDKLIVATSPDYPPFCELQGDKIVGYEPDIYHEIANRLGLKLEEKIMNFDSIITAVASGTQCDIGMSGISIDPEREKSVNFSDPYYTADLSFAVAERSDIESSNAKYKIYDSGLTFAVQSGTTAETFVKENYPRARCLAYTNANDCFSAVLADQADVVCSTKAVVNDMLKSSFSNMRVVLNVATGEEYGIAINKSDTTLLTNINRVLAEMKTDGTLNKIASKHGINVSGEKEETTSLKTIKCTAKANTQATSDVMSGKPTRITWEAQTAKNEYLNGIQFTLPEGVKFGVEDTALTMLTGEDLLTRTPIKIKATAEAQTIKVNFLDPNQIKYGAYFRLEIYDVVFPENYATEYKCAATYYTIDDVSHKVNDMPSIAVINPSWIQRFAEDINETEFVKAWNSNTFLNLFLNPYIFLLSIPVVFTGFLMALATVLCAFPLAIPLGLILALMRLSKLRVFRAIAATYVNIIRGTPLFLQIYIAFFGLPLAGINIPNFLLGLIVLAMNSSAYLCEIFRAGIQSIPKGQFEAARSLGMSAQQTMLSVVLPQAFRVCIPTMTSEFILLYKDTSLLASVGVMEIVMFAKTIVASTGSITPYIVAALFYLVITIPLAKIVGNLEKKFKKSHKPTGAPKRIMKKDQKPDKSTIASHEVFPKGGIDSNQMGSV
ncbi:MAG: ABC transporter substrate-binding protein/permease [Coriobacteriia bacterium]|nr:ABC transporter substrate-binding protein/permease [Coriobacteriia bacterium]